MNVIQIDNLTKRYGNRIGIEDLTLHVAEGELFGFLGPNGSGKTSTIRVLMGLLRADEGRARILESDCWHDGPRIRQDIGYLPGDLRLYNWMTCRNALDISGKIRRRDLIPTGLDLAEKLNLEPDLPVRKMSRGTRQKLGLILAMAHRPRLLILDEPTTGLDPLIQETFFAIIRSISAQGCTVFFSSHTLSEVERLCNRVCILRRGRRVAEESIAGLRERAKRRITIQWPDSVDSAAIAVPATLELNHRTEQIWDGTLSGPLRDLIRWCAAQPLADLTISPPDLNTVFQQYYNDVEAGT